MRKMSVTPPAQKATSRPAWKSDNMHKKKKQGWRPPSNRFHANKISERSNARVKTAAALLVSQPMRKHSPAAEVAVRYPSNSSAAASLGELVASDGHSFRGVLIELPKKGWPGKVAGSMAGEHSFVVWTNDR